MTLQSQREAESTRQKLRLLQQQVADFKSRSTGSHADELTLRSLTRFIKQLKEELARFEAKTPS